jgi:hypothetical protein
MRRRLPLLALAAAAAVVLGGGLIGGSRVFSTVVRRVEAWRQRPRVLAGADTFETVTVTEQAMVPQTGQFDSEPGDDLALVSFNSIRLLLPTTLAERQRVELGGDVRGRWTETSRLTRIGSALVVVDAGGGLDDPRVHDLDGTVRWRYRPDADVPPMSFVPADLDGDGDAEFYATISSYAVRLDAAGAEVWRVPLTAGRIVATAPRTRRDPAWIVAQGQGEMVVWDEGGVRLGAVTMKDARPLAVIDWPDGRYVLAGGAALRAVALDGRVVFDWGVPDMTVRQALPLSLEAGAPPAVALVAAGPLDVNGWRLQIVSRDKTMIYDEILGAPTELLKARAADGVDRLFLRRAGLLALRPRTG